MTVFGIMGFMVWGPVLMLIGGAVGFGLGRIIGSKFKSRLNYQNFDQRILFEMELVIKWAKKSRKKKILDDLCLMLLIETIVMELAYLLEKLHLKKVRKFFKKFWDFLMANDRMQCFLDHMPDLKKMNPKDELIMKKELYRAFSFYIPLTRILEVGDMKHKKYKNTPLFERLYHHVTAIETMESIIFLWEANETLSSQCAIPLEREELQQIVKDVIEAEEKTEPYKKLENRVMEEIISNTNVEDIKIDEEFERGRVVSTNNDKENRSIPHPDLIAQSVKLSFNNLSRCKSQNNSYSLGDQYESESKSEVDSDKSSEEKKGNSQLDEESKGEMSKKHVKRKIDEDFLDLQMTVDEDVSTWSKIWQNDDVIVYKKKTEGTPMVMIKAIATLKGIPKRIVFKALYDTDIRQQWDKLFHQFEVVEHDEDKMHTVLYYLIKAPIGISNRDFLQLRKVVHDFPEEGITYMHFKSIEHVDKPPVKKVVRAETIISGYVIEQIQDDPPVTQLVIISQNDIKGLIPKYLVNMASGKAPKQWVGNLITGWEELMRQEDEEDKYN
jgi:hypothetical protein